MEQAGWILALVASTLRVTTPLLFAALGGLMSERSGVVNIALEGMMTVGAFTAAAAAAQTHSPWAGLLAAGIAGSLFALLYGFLVIEAKADQIVAGTAMNFLAMGLIPLLSKALFDSTGSTPTLALEERFQWFPLVLALACAGGIALWLRSFRGGLWLQFAGEHPDALATAGVSVRAVRWKAVLASGWLAGWGGMSLSIALSSSYSRNMIAGRGFMALAALIFGGWKPGRVLAACLFFGFTDALGIRLQGVSFGGGEPIPVQFIQVLPYAATLAALAGFVGASRAPAKLGIPLAMLWITTSFSGCQMPTWKGVHEDWERLKTVMTGGHVAPRPAPSASEGVLTTAEAKRAQANSEMLQEIVKVTLRVQPQGGPWYSGMLNALNQGASLEGVHNGLIHSAMVRDLEKKSPAASAAAVLVFAQETAWIQNQLELERFKELGARDAGALASPEYPDGREAKTPSAQEKQATRPSEGALAERYAKVFVHSSLLTLKRVLSDQAQLLLDQLKSNPQGLAAWYGKFASRMAGLGVDFGVKGRNQTDEAFHRAWAEDRLKQGEYDKLLWETLNRYHRLMNAHAAETKEKT